MGQSAPASWVLSSLEVNVLMENFALLPLLVGLKTLRILLIFFLGYTIKGPIPEDATMIEFTVSGNPYFTYLKRVSTKGKTWFSKNNLKNLPMTQLRSFNLFWLPLLFFNDTFWTSDVDIWASFLTCRLSLHRKVCFPWWNLSWSRQNWQQNYLHTRRRKNNLNYYVFIQYAMPR